MSDVTNHDIIVDPDGLTQLCDRLTGAGQFAFDTEFVGEDGFQPEVCLVQVAFDSGVALIDPLIEQLDLRPFWELVADENIEKIVHAGMEDLAICWNQYQLAPAKIFDVQLAAGLVGMSYPMNLLRLARETAGVALRKSQSLTDWRKRPLTPVQIQYGIDDVLHLPKIHDRICEKLETLGRTSWAEQELEKFHQPETYQKDGRKRLRKLKGVGSLPRRGLAIAEALLDARDELARQYDRPRGAVLKDYLLMELVQRGWTDVQKIKTLRGLNLNDAAIRRLAEAVEQAKALPLEACPEPLGGSPDTPEEEVAAVLIQAVLRDYCAQNQLAYSLLATSRHIQATVRAFLRGEKDPASTPLMSGWRGQTIGKLVEGLLTGKSSVRFAGQVGQRHLKVE